MRSYMLPIAIVTFLGFVAIAPAWVYFTGDYQSLPTEDYMFMNMVLPAIIFMYIASWIKPEFARPVLGLFMLLAFIVLIPWLYQFVGMGATELGANPIAATGLGLAIPAILLSYIIMLGYRRFTGDVSGPS